MKQKFFTIWLRGLAGVLLLATPFSAFAKWEIEYSDRLINAMGQQGHFVPKRVGSYKTRSACEEALRSAVIQSGDSSLSSNMKCVGQDDPVPSSKPSTASKLHTKKAAEAAKAQQVADEKRQEAFNQEKMALLNSLKGVSEDRNSNQGNQIHIKMIPRPSNPPPDPPHAIDVEQIQKRIDELQRRITGIQYQLRTYSKALYADQTEFKKWGDTVSESYDEVIDSSKEYVMQMFLKYNLLGALEKNVQKSVYGQLKNYVNADDPAIRKWLLEESASRQIPIDHLKKIVDVGNLSGDFAPLMTGDGEKPKKNLDSLLFVNSLLETGEIVKYKEMLNTSKIFKSLPGEYFEQAKMIGVAYANLCAIGYSWYSINSLTKDVEHYSRKIDSLKYGMRKTLEEMKCLKSCLEMPTDRCMDTCSGKTRLSTPPPLPK